MSTNKRTEFQGFVNGAEYLALPSAPTNWVVETILPAGGLLNIFGPPKEGKTFAALGIALAVANGQREFLKWPVRMHGPVAYLQLDTPRSLFRSNYVDALLQHGHNVRPLFFADAQIVPYPFNILGDGGPWLQRALSEIKPVVTIIDTVREMHGGDENDSTVMRNVINAAIAAVQGGHVEPSAIILISHERKRNGDQLIDITTANRGSSYLPGKVDCMMRVANGTVMVKGRVVGEELVVGAKQDPKTFLWFMDDTDPKTNADKAFRGLQHFGSVGATFTEWEAAAALKGSAALSRARLVLLGDPSKGIEPRIVQRGDKYFVRD